MATDNTARETAVNDSGMVTIPVEVSIKSCYP